MLATLLALLACALVVLVCVVAFDAAPRAFLLLVPAGFVTFVISLLIGHFITEPLRLLNTKIDAFSQGNTNVGFAPDGRLYEADCLMKSFETLATKSLTQQADLARRERRQAAFISDVAHELRTPLTAIHGNAEMLLDPDLPPEFHEKFCTIIISESERLGRLSNDLLSLQRIEDNILPLELQRINLKDLVLDVIDTLDPILRSRHAHTEIRGEAPDVLGSPDRLRQVVSNLIDNASRFTGTNGLVTIELFGLRGNSVLAVKDDGEGFGDINPTLLFDRFYRTDSSRSRGTGGTGLGLAIVKSVVEAHDGTAEAVNLPDGGSCFIVAIPSISSE